MDITIEHQVKQLRDAGYEFTKEQAAILKKFGEMKQNRYDCGEMFEIEEDFEIISKTFDTLDELAADTVKQAKEYVKRYSF